MNKTLLRIDASARLVGSHSRALADAFQAHWLQAHPGGTVRVRDLAQFPIGHITATIIQGYYTPPEQITPELAAATALLDELIGEFLAADELLFSTPMYNFSLPSALKAYIDQIVRIGRTFGVNETGLHGLVPDKPTFVVVAAGAVYQHSPLAELNFVEPYLRALLGFLGITSVEFLTVEGTSTNEAIRLRTHEAALHKIGAALTL